MKTSAKLNNPSVFDLLDDYRFENVVLKSVLTDLLKAADQSWRCSAVIKARQTLIQNGVDLGSSE